MHRILLVILILLSPLALAAETTVSADADSMVSQMKTILDQYAVRIKTLEVENNILREEMRKAGIKIPLSVYSPAILQTPTTSTKTGTNTSLPVGTPTGTTPSISVSTGSWSGADIMLKFLQQNWTRYGGFVEKIRSDWTGIQWAYKLPSTSYIGGYEFVKQGADNHAFVDIIYDIKTATGTYDAKILYEYNTGTYQRKLIGFFEFNRNTGYYTTKSGNNPFPGVTRTFIRDPYASTVIIPTSATTVSGAIISSVWVKVPTYAEIDKAYTDKRYLSVISLSDTYLTANTATYDLLRIRYRTYFIIGKYTESLTEIAKIEAMGQLSSVACDAQVIATYSKNAALIAKYTTACKK
jgi:hypothetical protein